METNYPTLKRPKGKLCFFTNKKSSEQWADKVEIENISKMYDDLDDSSVGLAPSLLLDMENKQKEIEVLAVPLEGHLTEKHPICQMAEDVPHPVEESASPKPSTDLDIPFVGHGPVKSSTPIEGDTSAEEQYVENDQSVSPILFLDEEIEEAKKESQPIQEPQCNEYMAEKSDASELESPTCKIVLNKPKSTHKIMVESCKESHPGVEKNEGRTKAQRQENTDLPVKARKQEPVSVKSTEILHREPAVETSTPVGKEMSAFLQKFHEAEQPKPANSRKLPSPVNVPTLTPEPEDDFMILEDDTPFRFSIQSKNAKKKSQNKSSSTDKDSSTDRGLKDAFPEPTQNQQEPNQAKRKLQSESVHQKKKKKKENKMTEMENDMNENIQSVPEALPAVDLMEQGKSNKKTQQRLKKAISKETDEAEDKPKTTTSQETDEEKPQGSAKTRRLKSSKHEKENDQTSKAKLFKRTKKEREQRSSEEHADVEDLASLSDKEPRKSDAQTANGGTKRSKQSLVSKGSSSDSDQVHWKRKRNPPGQWWLSCPETPEETDITDTHSVLKKSKLNRKEPRAETTPPVKVAKKDAISKKKKLNTNKTKIKVNRCSTTRGDMKATVKDLQTVASEQVGDQDATDGSSPFEFQHRDHNFNSGLQVFPKVYHHNASENTSSTSAAPVSSGRPSEQLGTTALDKRRRKPPGAWWKVDDLPEDVEPIPPMEGKPRSKQSRSNLWGSKRAKRAASSKPPGGAPGTGKKQLASSEADSRSLATFKESDTSPTEAALNIRDADQNNSPAGDSATNPKANKEVLSIEAGHLNRESPPSRRSTFFRSGPSSMIELEQYEENDDMGLPSSRVQPTLCLSDLCASPLKPFSLQTKDRANLAEWLNSLWPATVNNGTEITPEQFDWYFYQGRAIGFMQDLQHGSIANGKILLGSYTKKPLWVDHSATTVFNLLTSSVSVNIDCIETRYNPGQSFMVQCGHAYSIQNLASQPAVLYYTRILSENPA